jgi:hypothetical protein
VARAGDDDNVDHVRDLEHRGGSQVIILNRCGLVVYEDDELVVGSATQVGSSVFCDLFLEFLQIVGRSGVLGLDEDSKACYAEIGAVGAMAELAQGLFVNNVVEGAAKNQSQYVWISRSEVIGHRTGSAAPFVVSKRICASPPQIDVAQRRRVRGSVQQRQG